MKISQYINLAPHWLRRQTSKFLHHQTQFDTINRIKRTIYRYLKSLFIKLKPDQTSSNYIRILQHKIPDLKVNQGPFKGMQYPYYKSAGSTLAPKLFGTYEAELHSIIEEICSNEYTTIIDIGCAEGYYAIGLAKRLPHATIYAYDIDERARKLCSQMAEINNVSHKVHIEGEFTLSNLGKIQCKDRKGFIISDCEGAEKNIFNPYSTNWNVLVENFDLLIEVHEFLAPGVTELLIKSFAPSHTIERIKCIDDIYRPLIYNHTLLQGMSMGLKIQLMAEARSVSMEWIYLVRKMSPKEVMREVSSSNNQ